MARRKHRRCRNCPDAAEPIARQAADKAAAKLAGSALDASIISVPGEGQKLWNHVLFGTSTCIGMMRGYADIGLPGNPVPQLQAMILMLNEIKNHIERRDANQHPSERLSDHPHQGDDPKG